MTFTEAAAEVLRQAGKPLHYKEITELAIERNLLSHVGKSPEVTMGARLAALLKKEDKTNPIVRVKPGVFSLRDFDGKAAKTSKKKSGDAAEAGEARPSSPAGAVDGDDDADDGGSINALEVEAAAQRGREEAPAGKAQMNLPSGRGRSRSNDDDDDAPILLSGADALRADLVKDGAEMFDDEDDDDQPILSGSSGPSAGAAGTAAGDPGGEAGAEGGRRRRRRRRRGRGGNIEGGFAPGASERGVDRASGPRLPGAYVAGDAGPIQPNAIVSVDADSQIDVRDPLAPAPRPMVRDRHQIMAGGMPSGIDVPLGDGEELAGRELADAVAIVLTSFDRSQGVVPLRTVVDALMRRGRLSGDPAAVATQVSATVRADNLRRSASSQRPRFRLSNGRVGMTDWAFGGDLARLEQDVIASIERYRDAARRTTLRRLQELPGHAFLELALFGLERMGMTQLKAVRRAGSPGGEAHFCGVHKTGSDEIRTAVVIRKDGREIGRERVSDLRGALHHYGSATAGWLVTTGQILSGAREEASAMTAAPVALYDGLALCRLFEDNDVGVVKTKFSIAIPDLDLFESLRGNGQ